MTETVEIGDPPIPVVLKKSARARRFSLRISNADGGVSLTMPKRAAKRDALQFASEQEGWLRRHLGQQPTRIVPVFGGVVMLDGVDVEIAQSDKRSVVFDQGVLWVPGAQDQIGAKLRGYFKALARDRLAQASEKYAAQVGRRVSRITLRDTRSRWGSCTTDGNLMYSWRLVMAPRDVQEYVAAHEVCHLVEMNHSAAYWGQVAQIFPDYRNQRQWLRDNGAALHRYVL